MLAYVREKPSLYALHHGEDEEGDKRGGQRQQSQPGANRHADSRCDPHCSCGRQTLDVVLCTPDGARAQEPDAGNDLGCHPRIADVAGRRKGVDREQSEQS